MTKSIKFTQFTVLIDFLVAVLIFIWISWDFGPIKSLVDFLKDFWLNLLFGVFSLILGSYYFGRTMGNLITIKNWNAILVGILGMLAILLFGTIGGSTVGFVEEGLVSKSSIGDVLFDYYYKPFYWIFLFGSIPTAISGVILGLVIKRTNVLQQRV